MRVQQVAPPQVPHKHEIIPIHASDVGAYLRCRRYWDWSSPTRTNLRHRVDIFGVNPKLWFGTGIHYALEKYYNPALKRDPVETWTTWYELQWNGGIVSESDLEYTYDLKPVRQAPVPIPLSEAAEMSEELLEHHFMNPKNTNVLYRVRGLRDLLPTQADEEFEGYRQLGIGMMNFYKDYAKRNDEFEVVAAESQFSIPLGFESKDLREDSPNYGSMLEVHARGKRDAIVFYFESGRYAIIDHKTAETIGDTYFKKLDRDPQISTYLWASQKEAEIHDLPWKNIQDATLQALRKGYPLPPTILKNGWQPSISKTNESTTAELFEEYVRSNDLVKWFEENEAAQTYYTYLVAMGDEQFIQREPTRRNKYEIATQDAKMKMIAREMLNEPNIYANQSGDWLCLNCQFRAPCLAADDGSDWQGMLADGYESNRDR